VAQRKFLKSIWDSRLEEDKLTRSYRVEEFVSMNVPAWAKPGGHEMEYRRVAMEKATLSWDMMQALITPYFAIPPFLEGMEKLHSLFKGETQVRAGKVFWNPPKHAPTHKDVIDTLEKMLEELTNSPKDPYPHAELITSGRKRFEAFLQSGRFPQFVQPSAPPEIRKRATKVLATGSDIAILSNLGSDMVALASAQTRTTSKRPLETLEEVDYGPGSPSKISRTE
jgi:hypothetical protein